MRADISVPHSLYAVTQLPTCVIGIGNDISGRIREIAFLPPDTPIRSTLGPTAALFCTELQHYLDDPAHVFCLPLASSGTLFQQKVWSLIRDIPAGQTLHYDDLAQIVGSVPRAIGQACGANPFPLVTPCHRVLARQGLGGFAHATEGWQLETKLWLIRHENPAFTLL